MFAYCVCLVYLKNTFDLNCRAASVSKRSEANERVLFEIFLLIYIYICVRTLRKLHSKTVNQINNISLATQITSNVTIGKVHGHTHLSK